MYNLSLPIYVLFYVHVWTDYAERVLSTVSWAQLANFWTELDWLRTVLYEPFIATCVDAIGTVFWDRPIT